MTVPREVAFDVPYMGVHCPVCAEVCPGNPDGDPDHACPACDCIPLENGKCGWCDYQVIPKPKKEAA